VPTWTAVLAVLVVGALTYANALHGPFLFDDGTAIENNLTLRSIGDLTTVLRPPVQTPVGGRPIVNLTFAVNYALGGLQVEGYHLVNVALHLLTALMLLGVLRRTFARTSVPGLSSAALDVAAVAATLFWTVHPLNTESVNYVSQRTELMAGLFYLGALYGAMRAVDQPGFWWIGVTALSAALAASSKESAVTLPIVLVLWDRIFIGNDTSGKSRPVWRWRVYAAGAASWITFALLAGQASTTRRVDLAGAASRWTYLLNQAEIIPHYLRRALWPSNLIFDYGVMSRVAFGDVVPGLLLLVALFVCTLYLIVRRPHLGFWGAWFWITLAPASSLVPIVTEVGAERRMYLPLIGIVCLFTLGAAWSIERLSRDARQWRVAGVAIGVMVLLALSATTILRNADYASGIRIWETVAAERPGARAHAQLSLYLRDAGRAEEAIAHLRLAAPVDPEAQHALAAALLERGDITESLPYFRQFVQQNPNDREIVLARREYARALRRSGDLAGAMEQLDAATRHAPGDVRNYIDLGDALTAAGRTDDAIAVYQRAEQIDARNVVVLTELGILLAGKGAIAAAMPRLRAALAIDPSLPAPRLQIVQLLLVEEKFMEAEAEARSLIATLPSNAEAHNLLGVALASQGRLELAQAEFAQAVSLKPDYVEAQRNLARIHGMPRSSRPR
jgi:Flp pilus assembly protein TadD